MIALIALATCLQDVKDAKCEIACKQNGYNSGHNESERCVCIDKFDYELYTGTRESLPVKTRRFISE